MLGLCRYACLQYVNSKWWQPCLKVSIFEFQSSDKSYIFWKVLQHTYVTKLTNSTSKLLPSLKQKLKYVLNIISPSHRHSLTPTLPLTIVSICCSLYLMHAGPPQSGHGCPERQVCDLPILTLWFCFDWNLVVSLVMVKKFFLYSLETYWHKSVKFNSTNSLHPFTFRPNVFALHCEGVTLSQ